MDKLTVSKKILAIETATFDVGAALVVDGEIARAISHPAENRHAEELFPLIEELLAMDDLALPDIDAFAVDIGPGLFTGLRVGVSAANALAYALRRPVFPIAGTTVLREALVRNFPGDDSGTFYLAIPVLDVRRGEVAFELSNLLLSGPGHILLDDLDSAGVGKGVLGLGTPDNFCHTLATFVREIVSGDAGSSLDGGKPDRLCLVLAGSGAYRYRDILSNTLCTLLSEQGNVTFVFQDGLFTPPVSVLGELAYSRFEKGGSVSAEYLQKPLYLREADAKAGAWKNAKLSK